MNFTNEDKQALIDGIATIPFKINIIKDGSIVKTLTEYNIINVDYEDFRYVDTDSLVIGQFVARKITGQLDSIYEDFEIEDTELEIQMGVSYNDNTNYYSLGNFLVTKPTNDEVKEKTDFEAMDYTKKFNKVFNSSMIDYPCTALQLATECCRQAGVELGTTNFNNYNFEIPDNQYVENETCRKVMQDIGKLAYSWVRIGWDNKCYLDFNVETEVDEQNIITNNNYYDLSSQTEVFGPVNRIVIGMRDVEGENFVVEDTESIEENGVTEIKIYDNNITYTPELREAAINGANRLFGLVYTPLETNTTGHPWLIGKEKIQINDMDDNPLYTYPWDRTMAYNGHIKTKLTSKADTKTETEYKNYGNIESAINKTRIIVDKQEGDITALTSRTQTLENEVGDMYNIEQVNSLVQNASTGITNTFSESGGNNIFRNTGLWFSASSTEQSLIPSGTLYPSENTFCGRAVSYEYWNGKLNRMKEEKASNGRAILLQNDIAYQEQIVANGKYTISFKYKKLINLANSNVNINGTLYNLSETGETEFVKTIDVSSGHITVSFSCDIDNGFEIYDLMVNSGTTKLAYGQNQNETTTDTVNISKGITITSTDTDTIFKANADGIRTLDKNENILTKFTDIGMTTKNMEVETEANIVGLLIQPVGNQVWFTKL